MYSPRNIIGQETFEISVVAKNVSWRFLHHAVPRELAAQDR